MALNPGSGNPPAADSMANAMVEAFKDQWSEFMEGDVPDNDKLTSLRHIFVAVSQGVIQHLRDNADAFQVSVDESTHSHTDGTHTHVGGDDGSHEHEGGEHGHNANVSIDATGTTA